MGFHSAILPATVSAAARVPGLPLLFLASVSCLGDRELLSRSCLPYVGPLLAEKMGKRQLEKHLDKHTSWR